MVVENDSLDYNLAYYNLSQARVNQLAQDQERYLFVNFNYTNDMIKNLYRENKNDETVFKVEFTKSTNGNFYLVKKRFYPETLYDYVTLELDNNFYDFRLENMFNDNYKNIDLRAVWYFLVNDRTTPFYIKWVRNNKYIFSYKRICESSITPVKERADIRVACKNVGLIKNPVTGKWSCPIHFNKNRV